MTMTENHTSRFCKSCDRVYYSERTGEFCAACLLTIFEQADFTGVTKPSLLRTVSDENLDIINAGYDFDPDDDEPTQSREEAQSFIGDFLDDFVTWQEAQPDYVPPTQAEIALFNQLTGYTDDADTPTQRLPTDATNGGDDA